MSIQLLYVNNGITKDITYYTGNYSRSDNIESLGMEFNFEYAYNPKDSYMNEILEVGGKVIFSNNGVRIFMGLITKVSMNDLVKLSCTCHDFGFYLNKSEAMIQFNNVSTSSAIERVCSENQIPIGKITNISIPVKKMYTDKISDIIKDLLKMATEQTGKKYRLEVRENLLVIDDYEDLVIQAEYKSARNIESFDVTKMIGDFSSEQNIDGLYDRIIVVSSSEKHTQILSTQQDDQNISKYGLITKIEKVDDKDSAKATQIGQTMLKDLNKVKKAFNVTLFGNDIVRAGRILVFNQPLINLVGAYLVKNCSHTYNGKTHLMHLDLEERDG